MANFNKVMLNGNLTRDPEVRYTPKGTAVTEIGLAVNRIYSGENNEKREETTFVDVTLWGRTAEVAGEYLKKGRPVFIEGRLQLDSWEDKQSGQKRSQASRRRRKDAAASRSRRWQVSSEEGMRRRHPSRSSRIADRRPPPKNAPPAAPDDDEIPF